MPHRFDLRVYFEDTDLAGIVYYANYLKFIERARSEWVRDRGVDQVALRRDEGIVFVVRHVEVDYLRPAVFDDLLTVETEVLEMGGASLTLAQVVLRGAERLVAAKVTLVAVGPGGRAQRLPLALREALGRAG